MLKDRQLDPFDIIIGVSRQMKFPNAVAIARIRMLLWHYGRPEKLHDGLYIRGTRDIAAVARDDKSMRMFLFAPEKAKLDCQGRCDNISLAPRRWHSSPRP